MRSILILFCALLCANVLVAQGINGGSPFSYSNLTSHSNQEVSYPPVKQNLTQGDHDSTELRGTPPISPATLLLLGLGGATVGFRVLNNKRKE